MRADKTEIAFRRLWTLISGLSSAQSDSPPAMQMMIIRTNREIADNWANGQWART